MKNLLRLTAVIELVAGAALLCWPSATVALLLGSGLDTPASVTLGRLVGAALFALGITNWLAQRDEQSGAARGVITAMTFITLARWSSSVLPACSCVRSALRCGRRLCFTRY